MTKLRLKSPRPIGAVKCSKCKKCKNSGVIFKVDNITKRKVQKTILCDSCTDKRKKWYNQRKDESGFIFINN